jgi:hypothetical protein
LFFQNFVPIVVSDNISIYTIHLFFENDIWHEILDFQQFFF